MLGANMEPEVKYHQELPLRIPELCTFVWNVSQKVVIIISAGDGGLNLTT